MSNFTAGPWNRPAKMSTRDGLYIGDSTGNWDICTIDFDHSPCMDASEAIANAQLIASAPELFEQLRVMTALCRLKCDGTDPAFIAEILKSEAVISKARGEI